LIRFPILAPEILAAKVVETMKTADGLVIGSDIYFFHYFSL